MALPRFDKATDDRKPAEAWPVVAAPVDVVLFEGWCVGARPDPDPARLAQPINALEAEADPDGVWRRRIEAALAGPYQGLSPYSAASFACASGNRRSKRPRAWASRRTDRCRAPSSPSSRATTRPLR